MTRNEYKVVYDINGSKKREDIFTPESEDRVIDCLRDWLAQSTCMTKLKRLTPKVEGLNEDQFQLNVHSINGKSISYTEIVKSDLRL